MTICSARSSRPHPEVLAAGAASLEGSRAGAISLAAHGSRAASPPPHHESEKATSIAAAASVRRAVPHLAAFFDTDRVLSLPEARARRATVLAWGARPSAARSRLYARLAGLDTRMIEDGFIRSVGLGKTGAPPVSLYADAHGAHFDASCATQLESAIAAGTTDEALLGRARELRERLVRERLSKYNIGIDQAPKFPTTTARRIVIADQVARDRSVAGAGASRDTFIRLLNDARALGPNAQLLIRGHPDVTRGLASGALNAGTAHVTMLDPALTSAAVLDVADEVWTVSSQLGFEALWGGIPVTCYGMPFYAGWGLTRDRAEGPAAASALARRAGHRPTVDELVAAAFFSASLYADPIARVPLDAEQALDRLVSWRDRYRERPAPVLCIGFQRWKRPLARAFLARPEAGVSFGGLRDIEQAPPGTSIAAWGMRYHPQAEEHARRKGLKFLRVEDGFLQSAGLGSDFARRHSLCIDPVGLHIDASRPSALENILSGFNATPALLERAQKLRSAIVRKGISKYNLGSAALPDLRRLAAGRPILLVPGQVPNDASIVYGHVAAEDNAELLRQVRAARPDAFIIYKEHPELVSGNRHGRIAATSGLADLAIERGDASALMHAVDEVHVRTSLAGFEALLRDKPVTCWGLPFYAGWGLTTDKVACERRERRLTLDELVAGALILYPAYADPETGLPITPEEALMLLERKGPARSSAVPIALRQILRFGSYLKAQISG